jgi:hypothetical protein
MKYPQGIFRVWSAVNNTEVSVDVTNLINPIQQNFKNIDLSKQWLDLTDPHFMNWMDISPSK